jgi:hypothetical protein
MIRAFLRRLLGRRRARAGSNAPATVAPPIRPSAPLSSPPPPPPPPRDTAKPASQKVPEVNLVMGDGTVRRAPDSGELGERIRYLADNLTGRKQRTR